MKLALLWRQLLFYEKTDQALLDVVSGESALLFFKQSIANTRALMLGAVLFAVTLIYYQAESALVLSWLVTQFVLGGGLTIIARHYMAKPLTDDLIMRFLTIRIILGNIIALIFAISLFILPNHSALMAVPVILLLLLMICIITIFRYAMLPSYFITINVSILLPIVAYLLIHLSLQNMIYLLVMIGGVNVIIYAGLKMAKTSKDVIVLNARLKEEIREHIETKEELESIALQDYLTGLGNRRLFEKMLVAAIARGKRENNPVLVLYIDLDSFKPINDRYGHEVGDKLLQEVAKRIKSMVRVSDTVARIGGDEFTVIMSSHQDSATFDAIVVKFDEELQRNYLIDDKDIKASASVGMSVYPRDGETWDELMRVADSKMYEAKLHHHQSVDGSISS